MQSVHGKVPRMYADNVLVLPDHLSVDEKRTGGGIILPSTAKPKHGDPVWATVVAAGPGWYDEKIAQTEGLPEHREPRASRRFVPMDPAVVPGARVLLARSIDGDPYYLDGQEHRIVRAESIVGVAE